MDAQIRKTRAAALSVVSNTVLVAGKLTVGLMIGSVSVLSEAIHSALDLVASAIAWFSVRVSGRPPDACHHFGHGKIENASGVIEALLIMLAAAWIMVDAVGKLAHPDQVTHAGLGVAIMAASVMVNWLISRHLFAVGRATGSVALIADAWHLRTDVWTSLGVMSGLLVMLVSSWLWPEADLRWIDPCAAIVVAILIIHVAWKLTIQAGRDLLDAALPEDEVLAAHAAAVKADPRINHVHSIRSRRTGAERHFEIEVSVPAGLSVEIGHLIAHQVESAIATTLPGSRCIVHIEPA